MLVLGNRGCSPLPGSAAAAPIVGSRLGLIVALISCVLTPTTYQTMAPIGHPTSSRRKGDSCVLLPLRWQAPVWMQAGQGSQSFWAAAPSSPHPILQHPSRHCLLHPVLLTCRCLPLPCSRLQSQQCLIHAEITERCKASRKQNDIPAILWSSGN